ncbi:TIGR01440 family protein [Cohnella algarum]|uniref:TIGR01440 family protein n=1 Tax=Cohnella algarum TaxID=2044859 RepID=UPI0019683451|nr:TIGR01440 family protein [Cohnella algarum]MBN2980751.1 TIGR01440 family protein [Cohnella algarum]
MTETGSEAVSGSGSPAQPGRPAEEQTAETGRNEAGRNGGEPLADRVERALAELVAAGKLRPGQKLVAGVSTSEVRGLRIGTAGAAEVAEQIYEGVRRVCERAGLHALWQCCEHLNRALVAERALAEAQGWTIVSAVPVPKAGGSMAAYAYRRLSDPCLVEAVQADAGIDIGETLIGMHLRPVAVPVRPSVPWVGEARVTMAYARPKLIGGERAVYELPADSSASRTCD